MKLKVVGWVVVLVVLVVAGMLGYREWERLRHEAALAQFKAAQQTTLATGAQARVAATQIARDSLAVALADAKALNGRLLATARLRTKAIDTTIVYDTIPTWLAKDGETRVAVTPDTTVGDVTVSAVLVAPPAPLPLQATLHIKRAPFTATVTFVEVGEATVAVVRSGTGEEVTIEAPYVRRRYEAPRAGFLARGLVDVTGRGVSGDLGTYVRVTKGWEATAVLRQDIPFTTPIRRPTLLVGVDRRF
jgi:hypothetical protein